MLDRLKKKHRVAKKEIQRAASLVRVRRHAQPPTEHPQVGKEWLLHARPGRRGAAVGVDGPRPAAVRLLACFINRERLLIHVDGAASSDGTAARAGDYLVQCAPASDKERLGAQVHLAARRRGAAAEGGPVRDA